MANLNDPKENSDEVAALIADFTAGVSTDLDARSERSAKSVLINSVAVALGALAHPAARAAHRHAARFATANSGSVVWGTTARTTPEIAALANGVLLRCYDYNDFFVGERNSGHGSDMVSAVAAAAEWKDASCEKTLAALAVGYEVLGAVYDAFSTAPGGWDYTDLTAIGATCAIAHVLDLNAEQTRQALAMTVIPHFASDEIGIGRTQHPRRSDDVEAFQRCRRGSEFAPGLPARLSRRRGCSAAIRR